MIKRYMKNTETGVVMPLELPLLNKYQNLVECDENGNVLGKANIDSGDLINRNATLQIRIDSLLDQLKSKELTIARLNAEIDLLKQQGKTHHTQQHQHGRTNQPVPGPPTHGFDALCGRGAGGSGRFGLAFLPLLAGPRKLEKRHVV